MRLYEGTITAFRNDVTQNALADKLEVNFLNHFGRKPSPSEKASWSNSSQFVKNVCDQAGLEDNMVVLEYELPYNTQRIDYLFFGRGDDDKDHTVLMELKQWSDAKPSDIEGNVVTYIGQAWRDEPHPSRQVGGYYAYLKDFVDVLHEAPPVELSACAYCHNYPRANQVMFDEQFKPLLEKFPLFVKEDVKLLGAHLRARLARGHGLDVFNRFAFSTIQPSKKLLEHTANTIKGERSFYLLGEQIAAYNVILDRAKKCTKLKTKSVIIVRGGPGTGKSVIALNVVADLLARGQKVFHATGSKAFTETLKKIVGTRAARLFSYFHNFGEKKTKENELEVLICDEAHRIRMTSNHRFTRKEHRSEIPQMEELMRVAKVSVFFIDDYQRVRPNEIGNSKELKMTAEKFGAEVHVIDLKTQFRCNGSDSYMNWVEGILGIDGRAPHPMAKNEKMEFTIFDRPQGLYEAIKAKNTNNPKAARLVAGFCWPWSNPNKDGTLVKDVVIGDFAMPWEGKDPAETKIKLAPGIPPWFLWAHDPNGVNQIGCIYTIQGFEFEYVGVVFGNDLTYDSQAKRWQAHPERSYDSMVKRNNDDLEQHLKNTYRTLLTRGMKGCYVYFVDKATEAAFREYLRR